MRSSGLALAIRPPAGRFAVEACDGARHDDLTAPVQVALLVAAVEQVQEGHGRVPDCGGVDAEGLCVVFLRDGKAAGGELCDARRR